MSPPKNRHSVFGYTQFTGGENDDHNRQRSMSASSSSSSFDLLYSVHSTSDQEFETRRQQREKCCGPIRNQKLSYVQRMAKRFEEIAENNCDNPACYRAPVRQKVPAWPPVAQTVPEEDSEDESSELQLESQTIDENSIKSFENFNAVEKTIEEIPSNAEELNLNAYPNGEQYEHIERLDSTSDIDDNEVIPVNESHFERSLGAQSDDEIEHNSIRSDIEAECDEFGEIKDVNEQHSVIYEVKNEIAEEKLHNNNYQIHEQNYDHFSDSSFDSTDDEHHEEDEFNFEPDVVPEPPKPARQSQISNVIHELIETEVVYISNLQFLIDNYMCIYNKNISLPISMRGQKYRIFGNVEQIKQFHETQLLPALRSARENILQISETFVQFYINDYFYIYVIYAMNRRISQKMFERNRQFFSEMQDKIGDKLGVASYLMQPIQRLPKYQLLLMQIYKELAKTINVNQDSVSTSIVMQDIKHLIAAVCRAEKNIQRLLDTVNDSISIADIKDCNSINLMHQGKFSKVNEFDIVDISRRRFRGNIFLFAKCLVYTEITEGNVATFRGHYPRDKIGIAFDDEKKNKFYIYMMKRDHLEIEIITDSVTYGIWQALLKEMFDAWIREERVKIREKLQANSKRQSMMNSAIAIRSSSTSGYSSASTLSPWTSGTSGSSRESAISNISGSSTDSHRTTWYAKPQLMIADNLVIQRIINSERHYVNLLMDGIRRYGYSIAKLLRQRSVFAASLMKICNIHRDIMLPTILHCEQDVAAFTIMFFKFFSNRRFEMYKKFAYSVPYEKYKLHHDDEKFLDISSKKDYLDQFIELPFRQLQFYKMYTGILLKMVKLEDSMEDAAMKIKTATIQMELDILIQNVMENYKLHSMECPLYAIKEQGQVYYSDLVTSVGSDYRLLLTDNAVVSVKIKPTHRLKPEKFIDVSFVLPYTLCTLTESASNNKRLKFFDNSGTKYSVFFGTALKRKEFIKEMNIRKKTLV